jgi:hypothetical protein
MRFTPFILILILLSGCVIPYPHTTTRSGPISGTVLDEHTHSPIAGAEIVLTQHPKAACKSDSSGHFMLKEIRSWHWGIGIGAGNSEDLPFRMPWDPIITVSHTNYTPRSNLDWSRRCDDVVLLKRLDEPSEPRPSLIFNGYGEVVQDMGAGRYVKPGDIRITARLDYGMRENPPSRIHIGFMQRVYDPKVTPVYYNHDQLSYAALERKGLDWEFGVYSVTGGRRSTGVGDVNRKYKLEFIP